MCGEPRLGTVATPLFCVRRASRAVFSCCLVWLAAGPFSSHSMALTLLSFPRSGRLVWPCTGRGRARAGPRKPQALSRLPGRLPCGRAAQVGHGIPRSSDVHGRLLQCAAGGCGRVGGWCHGGEDWGSAHSVRTFLFSTPSAVLAMPFSPSEWWCGWWLSSQCSMLRSRRWLARVAVVVRTGETPGCLAVWCGHADDD